MAQYVKHSARSLRRPCPRCGAEHATAADPSHPRVWEAHDTALPTGRPCLEDGCNGADGVLVVVYSDHRGALREFTCPTLTRSDADTGTDADAAPTATADPSPAPTAGSTPTAGALDPQRAAEAMAVMREIFGPPVDQETIGRMVRDELSRVNHALRVEVKSPSGQVRDLGTCHPATPAILSMVGAGLHVAMTGPAGSGKSTIARKVAEGLGRAFHTLPCCATSSKADLLGFIDANGRYNPSALYRAARDAADPDSAGSVFLLDEFDAATPAITVTANDALASRSITFPNGETFDLSRVAFLAAMNTLGRGPDRTYNGRQAQDGATLDRYEIEYIGYDLALEDAVCSATGYDLWHKVVAVVRALRERAESLGMPVILSPRRSHAACVSLAGGRPWADVVAASIRHGMSDADWAKLTDGVKVAL